MKKLTKIKQIRKIEKELDLLEDSSLYTYRKENEYHMVLGEGSLDAEVIFVGEAPGLKEAETGRPFCGASGKVLDELLSSIKLDRELVYITNIVKDKTPENRDPKPDEIALYTPYLMRQIEIIGPKVIVTLGRHAMNLIMGQFDLDSKILPIGQTHGKEFTTKEGLAIIPLYHPAVAVYNRKRLDTLKKDFELLKKFI